jgi:hypothetical protein
VFYELDAHTVAGRLEGILEITRLLDTAIQQAAGGKAKKAKS